MRILSFLIIAVVAITACERQSTTGEGPQSDVATGVEDVLASDALENLSGTPTDIAFWSHPTLAFNSMLITASSTGVTGYNMEDGALVSTIDGVDSAAIAVSYFGTSQQARGILALLDRSESTVHFYEVSNLDRTFKKLDAMVTVRGNIRDICFGRAATTAPTLYLVQKGTLTPFQLDLDQGVADIGAPIAITETGDQCIVDKIDGAVFVSTQNNILKIPAGAVNPEIFAANNASDVGDFGFILTSAQQENPNGALLLLNKTTGPITMLDRTDGHEMGSFRITATDEIEGVTSAHNIGASGANLGGLYRNGAVALTANGDTPTIKIVAINSVVNALDLTLGNPFNPRGDAPPIDDGADDPVKLDINFTDQ